MTQTFKIYRDGTLQRWATIKPQILPKTVKFMEDGELAVSDLSERLKGMYVAVSEHIVRVANS